MCIPESLRGNIIAKDSPFLDSRQTSLDYHLVGDNALEKGSVRVAPIGKRLPYGKRGQRPSIGAFFVSSKRSGQSLG